MDLSETVRLEIKKNKKDQQFISKSLGKNFI